MSYSLSFSADFYHNCDPLDVKLSSRPTSVWQAIANISDETWQRLADEVFDCEANVLDPIDVLAKIGETNTCSNLDSPVRVWIDKEGQYELLVYDSPDAA